MYIEEENLKETFEIIANNMDKQEEKIKELKEENEYLKFGWVEDFYSK